MAPPPEIDFSKIGPTAFTVSSARRLTDIPYAKELADLSEAQRLGRLPLILEARYKAINEVIARHRIKQFLELASGFLPRGLAISEDPGVTFIESDLPAMISHKRHLIGRLEVERPNLHFLGIDATARPNQFLQCEAHFKAGEPVMILCEGLMMYLTVEEKELVCVNVREVLQRYGGLWVTPDFSSTAGLKRLLQNAPELERRVQSLTNLTGRSLADNAFETLDQARQFVREQGFHLVERSMLNVADQLSCLEVLEIEIEAARKVLSTQSVFSLTLSAHDRGENR